jgi:hypothetical protein
MPLAERDIFLSHRSTDKDFVRKLAREIEQEVWRGRNLLTWVDEAEIPIGGSIPGHINWGLEHSRFVALVMTPSYFDSPSGWPDAEWHAALHVDPDNRRHRLLPLLAADCPYIPFLLRHLRGADLRPANYRQGFREVLRALREEPLPRPIAHRGQLVAPMGGIDRAQLVAERAVVDAVPDAKTELLQCNLLPVERLPQRIWVAPLRPELRRKRRGGGIIPPKNELIEAARAAQAAAGYERVFTPAFRVSEHIVSFHDLSDPGGALAGIVDDGAAEDFATKSYMVDEEQRKIAISLLNMAVGRHAHRCGLTIDSTKYGRFFFPPKAGKSNVISWTPYKNKASRTVAKPMVRDGKTLFWRHLGAYLKTLYLSDKLYLQIDPTWVLTEDGEKVKGGPDIGRVVIRWTGQERNLHVLYHLRFWTGILRARRPGPISVTAGDQTLDISQQLVFSQVPYGINADHKDLLNALDSEAQILSDEEDELIDEAVTNSEVLEAAALESEEVPIDEDDGPRILGDEPTEN